MPMDVDEDALAASLNELLRRHGCTQTVQELAARRMTFMDAGEMIEEVCPDGAYILKLLATVLDFDRRVESLTAELEAKSRAVSDWTGWRPIGGAAQ